MKMGFQLFFPRCAELRTGGAVHPKTSPMLRWLWLHGPSCRSQREGGQESNLKWGCWLHNCWSGSLDGSCLSRDHKNDRVQPVPNVASQWQPWLWPWGGRPNPRGILASPHSCVWVLPPVPRVPRLPALDREKSDWSKVCSPAVGAFWFWGPTGARLLENSSASNLRQVSGSPCLHQKTDQQLLPKVSVFNLVAVQHSVSSRHRFILLDVRSHSI